MLIGDSVEFNDEMILMVCVSGGSRFGLYEVCKGSVCDVRCGLCWRGLAVLREGPSPLCEAFPLH